VAKARHAVGDRFRSWTLRRFIAEGGNGEVWEVEGDNGHAAALKVLYRFGGDGYPRFKREVEIVSGLDTNRFAILPILDASIPGRPTRNRPPWYVMPLATEIRESLKGAALVERVGAIRQIAGRQRRGQRCSLTLFPRHLVTEYGECGLCTVLIAMRSARRIPAVTPSTIPDGGLPVHRPPSSSHVRPHDQVRQ
jgi:hypothetical protein